MKQGVPPPPPDPESSSESDESSEEEEDEPPPPPPPPPPLQEPDEEVAAADTVDGVDAASQHTDQRYNIIAQFKNCPYSLFFAVTMILTDSLTSGIHRFVKESYMH